jgi:hypothetical protein
MKELANCAGAPLRDSGYLIDAEILPVTEMEHLSLCIGQIGDRFSYELSLFVNQGERNG